MTETMTITITNPLDWRAMHHGYLTMIQRGLLQRREWIVAALRAVR